MSSSKKASSITPISELVKAVFQKISDEKAFSEEEIFDVWRQAVGATGIRHAKPVSLSRSVLRVQVDNPGWIQHLTLGKRKILKKLQSQFGKDTITEIRFRIGESEV